MKIINQLKLAAIIASITISAAAQTCNPLISDTLNTQVASSPVLDYLIQNVCVDANNRVISGDPAVCPLSRNVKIGERVPYIMTDVDRRNNGARYQGNFSYPVVGADNTLKVVWTKQLVGAGRPVIDANFQYNFIETRDAFDIIDVTDTFISAVRTSDPGCYDQKFSTALLDGTVGKRTNGWRLMPQDALPVSIGLVGHTVRIDPLSSPRPAGCDTAVGLNVLTVYQPPQPIKFESGRTLMSLQTAHIADANFDNTNNAIEKFFFTREYGVTRWEAWIPQAKCIANRGDHAICYPLERINRLHGLCPTRVPNPDGSFNPAAPLTSLPGYVVLGSTSYVRTDCRDASGYLAINLPALPIDATTGNKNSLVDVSWDKTTK